MSGALWQLPAHAGDARADQELVANEPEGETDQDRCEGRQPRPLRRIPNGRGRHPTAHVPGDSAAHCRTPAAAAACTGMRCSMVMRSRATEGRSASRCPQKWPRSAPSAAVRGARIYGRRPRRQAVSSKRGNSAKIHPGLGFIWGIPDKLIN